MASGDDSKSLQRVLEVNCISLVLVCANFMEHPALQGSCGIFGCSSASLSMGLENTSVECTLYIAQTLCGLVLLPCTLGWCVGAAFIAGKAKGGNH